MGDFFSQALNLFSKGNLGTMMNALQFGANAYGTIAAHSAQKKQANSLRADANRNAAEKQADLRARQAEADAAGRQKQSELTRRAQRERSRVAAIGAESGLGGNTLSRLLAEPDANLGFDVATLTMNSQSRARQSDRDAQAVESQRQSTFNQIKDPSWLSSGLSLLGGAGDFYRKQNALNKGLTLV